MTTKSKQPQPREPRGAKPRAGIWSRERAAALVVAAKRRAAGDCNCNCK